MEPVPPPSAFGGMTMHEVDEVKERVKTRNQKLWLALPLIIPAFFAWVWATNPTIVVVSGYGEVEVAASSALLTFSVVGQAGDPVSAINQVNGKVVATDLVLQNIDPRDISKSQVQVAPNTVSGGYQAVVSVGTQTADVASLEDLISRLYAAGALVVSQPVLSVNQPEVYEQQAFELALEDAKSQAVEIGNKNWRFFRRLTGISQTGASSTSTATKTADNPNNFAETDSLETGVFKISQQVTVSYKMW